MAPRDTAARPGNPARAPGFDRSRARRPVYAQVMTIGSALFLIALGAILHFAVADSIDGVDLGMIGVILMAVGALGLVIGLFLTGRSRRAPGEPIDRV